MSKPISDQLRDYASRADGWDRTLESLRRESLKGDPQALAKAAQEFEAFFIHYMLKVMREAIPDGGLLGDGQEKALYTSMLDQELAARMADRGGMGLAALIQREIEGKGALESEREEPVTGTSSPLSAVRFAARGADGGVAIPVPQASLSAVPFAARGADGGVTLPSFRWPIEGKVSSSFGPRRDPLTGQTRFHQGIDLVETPGCDVLAAASGEVVFSGEKGGYGRTVILRHADGYTTLYAHNLANLVREGEQVAAGQPIALLGSTGRSTAPHLHFEIHRDEQALDPLSGVELR